MVAVPVKGLDDKKIVQIACGQQHSIALDEDGYAHIDPTREGLLTGFPTTETHSSYDFVFADANTMYVVGSNSSRTTAGIITVQP